MHILFPHIASGMLAVVLFILLLPTLTLTVRRLHDTERNGALILITVAPLAIMAVISLLSVLFFTTSPTRVSETIDNGWRIIDVPDEYIAENGDVLWDSIKDPNAIVTYTYGENGDLVMQPQESQTRKTDERRMALGTAGIMSMLFIFWIISFVLMIVWCAQPGTEGPNRYGPDPRMT